MLMNFYKDELEVLSDTYICNIRKGISHHDPFFFKLTHYNL